MSGWCLEVLLGEAVWLVSAECLEVVEKLSGGCLEGVWRVSRFPVNLNRTVIWMVSGSCLKGVWKVSGGCLESVLKVF